MRGGDVLFLDDIGENCRMAREVGMRTIKVQLGRTEEAVRELGKEIDVDFEAAGVLKGRGGEARL